MHELLAKNAIFMSPFLRGLKEKKNQIEEKKDVILQVKIQNAAVMLQSFLNLNVASLILKIGFFFLYRRYIVTTILFLFALF